jgi:hypothetical protein
MKSLSIFIEGQIEMYCGIYDFQDQYYVWKDDQGELHRNNDQPAFIANFQSSLVYSWYFHGKIHRNSNDKPAKIGFNGVQWFKYGNLHRDHDMPSSVTSEGMEWKNEGILHRNHDNPAMILINGAIVWCEHGKAHRNYDLPAKMINDQLKEWWQHGKLYRRYDLPARIENGDFIWYKNEEKHRDNDCPAVILSNGMKAWFQDGFLYRDNNNKPTIVDSQGHRLMASMDGMMDILS